MRYYLRNRWDFWFLQEGSKHRSISSRPLHHSSPRISKTDRSKLLGQWGQVAAAVVVAAVLVVVVVAVELEQRNKPPILSNNPSVLPVVPLVLIADDDVGAGCACRMQRRKEVPVGVPPAGGAVVSARERRCP